MVSTPIKSAVGVPKTGRAGSGGVAGAGVQFYAIILLILWRNRSARASRPQNQLRCRPESAVAKIGSADSFLDFVGQSNGESNDSFLELLRPPPEVTEVPVNVLEPAAGKDMDTRRRP